jgi:hypothetical protein
MLKVCKYNFKECTKILFKLFNISFLLLLSTLSNMG